MDPCLRNMMWRVWWGLDRIRAAENSRDKGCFETLVFHKTRPIREWEEELDMCVKKEFQREFGEKWKSDNGQPASQIVDRNSQEKCPFSPANLAQAFIYTLMRAFSRQTRSYPHSQRRKRKKTLNLDHFCYVILPCILETTTARHIGTPNKSQ